MSRREISNYTAMKSRRSPLPGDLVCKVGGYYTIDNIDVSANGFITAHCGHTRYHMDNLQRIDDHDDRVVWQYSN